MIDKELSELKKDLPEYNIDNYKSGIYTKYNNKKNTRNYLVFLFFHIFFYFSISFRVDASTEILTI